VEVALVEIVTLWSRRDDVIQEFVLFNGGMWFGEEDLEFDAYEGRGLKVERVYALFVRSLDLVEENSLPVETRVALVFTSVRLRHSFVRPCKPTASILSSASQQHHHPSCR
jgi:hypothetical protein